MRLARSGHSAADAPLTGLGTAARKGQPVIATSHKPPHEPLCQYVLRIISSVYSLNRLIAGMVMHSTNGSPVCLVCILVELVGDIAKYATVYATSEMSSTQDPDRVLIQNRRFWTCLLYFFHV